MKKSIVVILRNPDMFSTKQDGSTLNNRETEARQFAKVERHLLD